MRVTRLVVLGAALGLVALAGLAWVAAGAADPRRLTLPHSLNDPPRPAR